MLRVLKILFITGLLSLYSCSPVVETSEEFAVNGEQSIEKSIEYLDRIVDHDGSNADALFQRARLELSIQQPLKAKEDIVASLSIEPQNPEYLMLKAKIDAEIGQNADAINSIEKILKMGENLNTVEAQLFATNLYLDVNNLNKAEYFLQQAALSAPELPEVLYQRAKLYTIRHDTLRAIAFYKQILLKDSLHKGSLTDMAEISFNRNKSDTALILLSKIPGEGTFKYNVLFAKSLMKKGLADSAVKFWGKALLLSPRDAMAHFELGKYYYATEFYQNAVSHFVAVPENDRRKYKDFYLMYAYSSYLLPDSGRGDELFHTAKMLDSNIVTHKILQSRYRELDHLKSGNKSKSINLE